MERTRQNNQVDFAKLARDYNNRLLNVLVDGVKTKRISEEQVVDMLLSCYQAEGEPLSDGDIIKRLRLRCRFAGFSNEIIERACPLPAKRNVKFQLY